MYLCTEYICGLIFYVSNIIFKLDIFDQIIFAELLPREVKAVHYSISVCEHAHFLTSIPALDIINILIFIFVFSLIIKI